MKKMLLLLLLLSRVVFAQDTPRCKDSEPSYISRMPGFSITNCENSDFNEYEFIYYVNGKAQKLKKGGKFYHLWYTKNGDETAKFSGAQVKTNYLNAVLKAQGKALDNNNSLLSASINGKEVYIEVHTTNSSDMKSYHIVVLEVEPMKQEVTVNLQESIDRDGKVALYGILFDTGKSDIRPESNAALKQIIDYLTANPSVKIFVVGHTDNSGTFAGNMALSKARAGSVMQHLITTGKIASDRLTAEGVGPLCPVSTNSTEAGKALNRRVEIVKQ